MEKTKLKPLPEDDKGEILMLQTVKGELDQDILIFYDSGCSAASISTSAVNILKCPTIREGPTQLHTTGDETINSPHGDVRVSLKMKDGKMAEFNALQLDEVTQRFPCYQQKEAWTDLNKSYKKDKKTKDKLPPVDDRAANNRVGIMLGIKYQKYFPKLIYQREDGLAIYESCFQSKDGNTHILAGPHKSFREENEKLSSNYAFYFSKETQAHRIMVRSHTLGLPSDFHKLQEPPFEGDFCYGNHCYAHRDGMITPTGHLSSYHSNILRDEINFEKIQNLGTKSNYRCEACRNCSKCLNSENLEEISMKEEREQSLLEAGIRYDRENAMVVANLPFSEPPAKKLTDNIRTATAVLNSQIRGVEKKPETREELVKAHDKLVSRGYAVKLSELPPETREAMKVREGSDYYLPWAAVRKQNSLSSPVRLVFNASSRTPNGESLNAILCKGQNQLTKLYDILIKLRFGKEALIGDIRMMYNNVKLADQYLKYQKYLWRENLEPDNPIETYVITTLIYGVKPSGNQCIHALKLVADECNERYPEHKLGDHAVKNFVFYFFFKHV